MRIAHLDCFSGIAGDMTLAALVDAGAPLDAIREGLGGLPLSIDIRAEPVMKSDLRATRIEVTAPAKTKHRDWAGIRGILESAPLAERAASRALAVFARLAEAEARVHGVPEDEVTFHEAGAADAIADVVGVALALEALGVDRVTASEVPVGRGELSGPHGLLPNPPPAVAELLRGAPLRPTDTDAEIVTPTGAALLSALAEAYGAVPAMTLEAVGYGAGTLALARPNVLRVLVGEAANAHAVTGRRERVQVMETTVDDLEPELQAHAVRRIFEAGAVDAWLTPVVGKKGRPAVVITAMCPPERGEAVVETMFVETGTLGVRVRETERRVLDREVIKVATTHGVVGVKVGRLGERVVVAAPEFEDCARVAAEAGVPARLVHEEARRLAHAELGEGGRGEPGS